MTQQEEFQKYLYILVYERIIKKLFMAIVQPYIIIIIITIIIIIFINTAIVWLPGGSGVYH